jgi:hypothetical protein
LLLTLSEIHYAFSHCFFLNLEKILELLGDDLHSVQDPNFIEAFTKKFEREQLEYSQDLLKDLRNPKNPLMYLLNHDKEEKKTNLLVKNAIRVITSSIKVDSVDVISDAFYNPSSDTLTYAALFNESLKSLPIHQETMKYLNQQWETWENGVLPQEIAVWSKFNQRQKTVTHKIWSMVTETLGEHQLDALFDANYRDMQRKSEMNDKVVICLKRYCERARDYDIYNEILRVWYHRFQSNTVGSIEMPEKLQELLPYAEKLNPYSDVRSWRAFLQKNVAINGKSFYTTVYTELFRK